MSVQVITEKADCASCEYFTLEGCEGVCEMFNQVIEDPEPYCSAYKKNEDLSEND